MTFLQPALLTALPLAAAPVVIHLVHLYRRRQVKWAAMIFLRAAQKMNKGLSRLRQVLILALRVLVVLALILAVSRPLAGGWLGLTGSAPETVLVLVDRSASMEAQAGTSGASKRLAGLQNLGKALADAVGTRSHLVLIDSATLRPQTLPRPDALTDSPATEATATAADLPALWQAALDYVTINKTGRTDIWLLSDLQRSDWNASDPRWEGLRAAWAALPGVHFHLLCYPQAPAEDLGVNVDAVTRTESGGRPELLLDWRLTRRSADATELKVPVRFVVNGSVTTETLELKENQRTLRGYSIPIDKNLKRGWGRVELPADAFPANDVFHFVFDEPAPLQSVIISDDDSVSTPLRAALSAANDPTRHYAATVLPSARAAEIAWTETALVVWQAPLPPAESTLARQLQEFVAAGHSLLFLPPEHPEANRLFGLGWGEWQETASENRLEWWRSDAEALANTRDGAALPVGSLEVQRRCVITGDGVPLARLADHSTLLAKVPGTESGSVYLLGTLPGAGFSSLARDGVVMYALLHRALQAGAATLGHAQQRACGTKALGGADEKWELVETGGAAPPAAELPLRAGVVSSGERLVALNRPPGEDLPATLTPPEVERLFAGLDFRILMRSAEEGRSLTNEVWRAFLFALAAALLAEALLCLPPPREVTARIPA